MGIKLFISYSHKDDQHRQHLTTRLSTMREAGEIEDWDDTKIPAGGELDDTINENLNSAHLILLLLSPDFLASRYCTKVEMRRALERHEQKSATVVPVILRHCDWKSTSVVQLKALPQDGKPIATWDDLDDAWQQVVQSLRQLQKETKKVAAKSDRTLTTSFAEWLNDTEIKLSHRNADRVTLSDVYVKPDLKVLDENIDALTTYKDEEWLARGGMHLVLGEEQVGKTSLAKSLCSLLAQRGYSPILLNGDGITNADIDTAITRSLKIQYQNPPNKLEELPNPVLIIDDFSKIKLNKKFTSAFVVAAKNLFGHCIFLAHDSYQYVATDIEALDSFSRFEISYFGNAKRAELIEKWASIGVAQQIDDATLVSRCDDLTLRINALIRKNVVPPKPIYLLSLLQILEAYSPQKLDLTAYGHCYQHLVYQALDKARIARNEIDKYLNILTELAWTLLPSRGTPISGEK